MNLINNGINPFQQARGIKRPLILDGAMGSLLQQRGIKPKDSLWTSYANISHPEIVEQIHSEYINLGADIITTNTFRTNPAAITHEKIYSSDKLVKAAVDIAKKSAKNSAVFIAGSNAPAEDCYTKKRTLNQIELEANHSKHIDLLYSYGVDFILNETQSHFDEIEIICKYCFKNNVPYILSIYVDDDLKLLSGEIIADVLGFISDHAPLAVGYNCIRNSTFAKIYQMFVINNSEWGFYLNCGAGKITDENISTGITPEKYAENIQNYLNKSPSFMGACCGSNPSHIKHIKWMLDGQT
jgi:homocysteine S-methyltransferase